MKSFFIFCIVIISIIVSFSSTSQAQIQEGEFEKMLRMNNFIEEMELSLPKIEARNIKNKDVKNRYNELKRYDTLLRNALLQLWRDGEIDSYIMQDITHNYSLFIYFANKAFLYHEIEEYTGRTRETSQALQNSYETMRTYYVRVKYAIAER